MEIYKPIYNDNRIVYPVNIRDHIYNFEIKYNRPIRDLRSVEGGYGGTERLRSRVCAPIDGMVSVLAIVAICEQLPIVSKFPVDPLLYENLMRMPKILEDFMDLHPLLFSGLSKPLTLTLNMETKIE